MEDWLTYRLSDLLLFSPRTYYRLFELYNRDLWPVNLAFFGAGMSILALLRRGPHVRVVLVMLSACWLWVAWAFHVERYATINWAARYFAAAFVVQAALMSWSAIRGRRHRRAAAAPRAADRVALGVCLFALFVEPLIGPLVGRPWTQLEIFGAAPDPTAVATLGVLALPSAGAPRYLLIVPMLWCAISGATLWVMGSRDAPVAPAAGLVAVAVAVRGRRARPPDPETSGGGAR